MEQKFRELEEQVEDSQQNKQKLQKVRNEVSFIVESINLKIQQTEKINNDIDKLLQCLKNLSVLAKNLEKAICGEDIEQNESK